MEMQLHWIGSQLARSRGMVGSGVSTLSVLLGVVLGGFLLLWALHCSSGWRRGSKSGARLPKGSLGWPIIGETAEFARHPRNYVSSHVKRYGSIFKSSLMLQPMIIGTTPEFAKFVISNSKIFVSGWPASVRDIVGPRAFAHKDGPEHVSIKKILQKPLLPEALRTKVDVLETIVLENLASWAQIGTVVASDATAKITSDMGVYFILGVRNLESTPEAMWAIENLMTLNKALISTPVNIPGSAYNKGLKSKVALRAYFNGLLKQRKEQKNSQADMLGFLSAAQEDPQAEVEVKDLDDETIADSLTAFWFGAFDATKTTLTWILKLLVENPDVFRRIQAEQYEILKGKDLTVEEPRLTWEDTRKMVYASQFFQEVQRIVSIVPFVIRKATQEMEYKGVLIPKGWGVLFMLHSIHNDPANHLDPTSVNPDRFDVSSKPFTCIPFSAGPHMCPGMETAKLISLIYIHHLTTTYVFESAGPEKGIEFSSFPTPVGGYPINIRRRTSN